MRIFILTLGSRGDVQPYIALGMGIPRVMSVPLPIFTPTVKFPSIVFPAWPLGGWYNRLTYTMSVKLAWLQYRSVVNSWREKMLGPPPAPRSFDEMKLADGRPTPTLYPFSEHVDPGQPTGRPRPWPPATGS